MYCKNFWQIFNLASEASFSLSEIQNLTNCRKMSHSLINTPKLEEKSNKSNRTRKKCFINQTIKMKLHTKRAALHRWIENGVELVSEVAIHVSRFSNMYVLHCLENNFQLPRMEKHMFDEMMYLVTNTTKADFDNSQMKNAFNTLYKPLLNQEKLMLNTKTVDDGRLLESLTSDMKTNVCVYLRTQFLTRFRQWCTQFIIDLVPIADKDVNAKDKKAQRWKIVNYLFRETALSDSNITDPDTLIAHCINNLAPDCSLIWQDLFASKIAVEVADFRALLQSESYEQKNADDQIEIKTIQLRPITYAKLLNAKINHAYMKWMYKYLLFIEKHNLDKDKKQKRVFSLMPIRSLDRCYISISNTALSKWIWRYHDDKNYVGAKIYKKCLQFKNGKEFKADFEKHKIWYWKQCFDLKKVLGTTNIFGFDGPITTDGVGCSVAIEKKTKTKTKDAEKENMPIKLQDDDRSKDAKAKLLTKEELEEADIVGVDPGRNTLWTSAIENPDGKYNITKYSADKWKHMSGGNKAKKKREKWAKQMPEGYNDWLLAMPTTKVSSVEGMQKHVRHLMLRFEECFALNGKKRVRNQRLTSYIQKQKSLSGMVNEFLGQQKAVGSTKKKLIVAFGDASFKTSGPTRKMKEELKRRANVKVVDVDEFHTSLMTNCCAFAKEREAKAVERVGPVCEQVCKKDGSVSKKSLYSVTFCQGCSCIWNRDVNAAINMLQVYRHSQKNKGARHSFFSRSVATSKKQKQGEKRKAERVSKAAGQVHSQIEIVDENKKKRKVEKGNKAVKKVVPKIYIVPDKKRKVAAASSVNKKKKIEQKGVSSNENKAVCSLDSSSAASASNTSGKNMFKTE